ncbi:hypothetical protein [Halorubrum vacuolatum]|uniref:Uncharacterized protein n=1 Tax=Halorubrum vacuolatum TaxID=63740 RepID=A0A238X1T1_HALVU|nr:hypothetical protein [Halorubrum vacuolatum]SNR52817.1 hypothetical protein SAMN06264855_11272 [Halorubrum vacuolatum]
MKRHLLLLAGVLGLLELLAPRVVLRGFTAIAYRGAEDAEPRDWLPTAVRVEGAILVFAALVGLYKLSGTANAEAVETTPDGNDENDGDGRDD